MLNGYFYPHSRIKAITPYYEYFMNHLEHEINFLNRNSETGIGILDMVRYIFRTDVAFLNFPEEMIDKKYGFWQFLIFLFIIVPYFKLTGKKIVWTMHNKKSHYSQNERIKNLLYNSLMKHSNIIVVHATNGKNIVRDHNSALLPKVFFFPHPVKDMGIPRSFPEIRYDFIIWGTITHYKNIDGFLEYLHSRNMQHKFKILIAGKIKSRELEESIKRYLTENIILINRYITDDELVDYILSSRIILFPYIHDSVLASGALVYSLNFRKPIIGPRTGAFQDLEKDNLVYTFETYDDLAKIDTTPFDPDLFTSYVKEVSWEVYTKELMKQLVKS